MSNYKDYYKILGVPKNATQRDIKAAYRKLAMMYHPDKLKDGTSDKKMQEINEAYDVLGDPKKRANYDLMGSGGPQMGGFRGANTGGFGGGFGMNFSDIFNDIFGGFRQQASSDNFQQKTQQAASVKQKGEDIYKNVKISFEDSIKGTEIKEKLTKFTICETCKGEGAKPADIKLCSQCKGTGRQRFRQSTPFGYTERISACTQCKGLGKIIVKSCTECAGEKYTKKAKKVKVIVAPGAKSGDEIKLPGFGDKGINGGPAGDMYVVLDVKPHKYYIRQGLDIIINPFPVSFIDIVKQNQILVPTPTGNQSIVLKNVYNSGQLIRLKGYGITNKSGQKGDLILKLDVIMPDYTELQFKELAQALEKFSDNSNENLVKNINNS